MRTLQWASATAAQFSTCTHPQMVEVSIDASEVPSDYILAILSQCSTFPEVRQGGRRRRRGAVHGLRGVHAAAAVV